MEFIETSTSVTEVQVNWSLKQSEQEIAGDKEHSHRDEESHEENRRCWRQVRQSQGVLKVRRRVSIMQTRPDNEVVCVSALYTGVNEVLDEVQVPVISSLVIECVVIGGWWSLTCL
ncbi:hypothetical protein DPX16_12651 [Anabarilius grahami]|uniref:Uncharacterized protein n=1 Tax=Anabarilius grahami TaxID=495550 RepID=A0A3N0YM00_ANAGA|nr:hypothetical protein DPX16_12651 [Anabarilius grahami]